MNLCIDIGNSRTKFGLFNGEKLIERWIKAGFPEEEILELANRSGATCAIVSSVATPAEILLRKLGSHIPAIELTTTTKLPFENRYTTPHTLGKDRLAAVAGARALFPGENCLVVDCGTCIKYEVLTSEGVYLGGNIAPGLTMRIRAMHEFTARLPEVEAKMPESAIGISTETALQNGALRGAMFEVEGFIRHFEKQFNALRVIFSGGDAAFVHAHLAFKNAVIEEDLTLYGLNKILNFNQLNDKIS